MTTGVLWNTAIPQFWALALGERLQPAIGTETEAQAAQAALVHEIFSALRSALVRRVGNPPGPSAAHGHRTCSDDAQPHTRDASPARAMRKGGDDTTAAGSPSPTGGPGNERHTNSCALSHKPRRPRASQPRPKEPLVQPNYARPRNAPQQRLSVGHTDGKDVNLPDTCNRYPKGSRAALAARGLEHERRPNDFLLHPLGGGHASQTPANRLQQRKGRRHIRTRSST